MHATDIVAWAYDADLHCPDCARAAGMTKDGAADSEWNAPTPLFASDEGWQNRHCGTCNAELGAS